MLSYHAGLRCSQGNRVRISRAQRASSNTSPASIEVMARRRNGCWELCEEVVDEVRRVERQRTAPRNSDAPRAHLALPCLGRGRGRVAAVERPVDGLGGTQAPVQREVCAGGEERVDESAGVADGDPPLAAEFLHTEAEVPAVARGAKTRSAPSSIRPTAGASRTAASKSPSAVPLPRRDWTHAFETTAPTLVRPSANGISQNQPRSGPSPKTTIWMSPSRSPWSRQAPRTWVKSAVRSRCGIRFHVARLSRARRASRPVASTTKRARSSLGSSPRGGTP